MVTLYPMSSFFLKKEIVQGSIYLKQVKKVRRERNVLFPSIPRRRKQVNILKFLWKYISSAVTILRFRVCSTYAVTNWGFYWEHMNPVFWTRLLTRVLGRSKMYVDARLVSEFALAVALNNGSLVSSGAASRGILTGKTVHSIVQHCER